MNESRNQSNQYSNYRLPPSDASIDEWQAWGLKLVADLNQMKADERARIKQLRKIRKELKHKNKVLGHYKSQRRQLEDRIMTYENSCLYKIQEFLYAMVKKENKNRLNH